MGNLQKILIFIFILKIPQSECQVIVNADGSGDAYKIFNKAFGGNAVEDPDCSHQNFGKHITQVRDRELNRQVFAFHIHVRPDNDRCTNTDRQRNEVKTYGPSPEYLKARVNERTTYSWNFKLDSNFAPSTAFCHIHQIKVSGGNDGSPVITITPRKGRPNTMQIIHVDNSNKRTVVRSSPLAPFLGKWIHVVESLTHSHNGQFSVRLTNLQTGEVLLNFSSNKIDLWRSGSNNFSRPKWGIYRSLNDIGSLKNETVYFDRFCLAKGNDKCT